jgi:hypothetical protein
VALEPGDRVRAHDRLALPEAILQFLAMLRPPRGIELLRHHFVHHDLVALRAAGPRFPQPSAGARAYAVRPPKRPVSSS